MRDMETLLSISASRHSHLCPRQVLGIRMGLAAGEMLGLDLPRKDKTLIVIAETDGCFIDGLEVATGVSMGHRTLRMVDYGKIAATFVNAKTGDAVRFAPQQDVRALARLYAPEEARHYFAQLVGYQRMPAAELFTAIPVFLTPSLMDIMSRPGVRAMCSMCGEEIINEREIYQDGITYCRSCFGQTYYQIRSEAIAVIQAAPVSDEV